MDIGPGEVSSMQFSLGPTSSKWTEFKVYARCEKCEKTIEQDKLEDEQWDEVTIGNGTNEAPYSQVHYCPHCREPSMRWSLKYRGDRWPRWIHRLYAEINHMFWIPCPLCGKMFGGHERHGTTEYVNGRAKSTCGCNGFDQRIPDLFQSFSPDSGTAPAK